MGSWTLDDIPWDRFDATRLDPGIVCIVKAASLVEYNGAVYSRHLCDVFADDPHFLDSARRWGEEEVQHGAALAHWAALADPSFDFAASFARFQTGYRIDFTSGRSRRGSRAGEMLARCIVETGTSSYYTALRDASTEPVLREICRRIAADELRHYRLFYKNLRAAMLARREARRAERQLQDRARPAGGRTTSSRYAAAMTDAAYDPTPLFRAARARTFALCRAHHIERGVAQSEAVGL